MYVFNTRQRAEYLRTLLMLPPADSEEHAKAVKETLDAYTAELFPFYQRQETAKSQSIQQVMEREMARGPLVVHTESQQPTSKRSRKRSPS